MTQALESWGPPLAPVQFVHGEILQPREGSVRILSDAGAVRNKARLSSWKFAHSRFRAARRVEEFHHSDEVCDYATGDEQAAECDDEQSPLDLWKGFDEA